MASPVNITRFSDLLDLVPIVPRGPDAKFPISVKFTLFEPFQEERIVSLMPRGYSRQCQTPYQPIVINPQVLPEMIQLGTHPLAVEDNTGNIIYVISNKPEWPHVGLRKWIGQYKYPESIIQQIPCCFKRDQGWEENVPWEILSKMKIRKAAGDFMVFVNPTFNQDEIITQEFTVIPELWAILVNPISAHL